jgi:hypothetical protein
MGVAGVSEAVLAVKFGEVLPHLDEKAYTPTTANRTTPKPRSKKKRCCSTGQFVQPTLTVRKGQTEVLRTGLRHRC